VNSLEEILEWLRIEGVEDEPNTIPSLLLASKMIIKQSTGLMPEDITDDPEAVELYKLIQKMIVTDLYENRAGSKLNSLLIGLCAQLEVYKLAQGGA